MTFLSRFSLAAALVVAVGLGAAAHVQNTNGGPGPFMGRGGPPPGGRFGGPGGPGGPLGPLGPILQRLNLTESQKNQVKGIVDSHRDEMNAIADRARPAHDALDAAITADTLDEAMIRARSMDVAAIDADMVVLQARIRSEVFQILTPEQQAQAKQSQAEHRGGRGRGRGRQ